MALLDLSQNRCGRFRPNERLRVFVMLCNKRANRPLEFTHTAKCSTANTLVCDFGEEPFYSVEPRRTGRREVHVVTRSFLEPRFYQWMFVRRVIIHNEMYVKLRRHAALDAVEELQELSMPVAWEALFNDVTRKRIKRRKQCRRPIAHVVVGLRGRQARTKRQNRRGSIQRLNAAFLVDAEDHGINGRVHVQSDDVSKFLREVGILAKFERTDAMRLQIMGKQNSLDRTTANAKFRRKRPRCPMRCVLRSRGHNGLGQLFDRRISDDLRPSRSVQVSEYAFNSKSRKAFANLHHAVARNADAPRNLRVRQTLGCVQNNSRTDNRSLRHRWFPHQLNQGTTIFRTNGKARYRTIRHAFIVLQQPTISNVIYGSTH